MEDLKFLSRIIHLVRKVIISGVIYILYLRPLHLKKKNARKYTTKAQPVTMIANNEINENGLIFSHPPLVDPAGFLKNQFNPPPPPPPPPYHFFGNFIVLSEKG